MAGPLILVGQVAGAFGVRGEIRITAFTADPASLAAYSPLLAEDGRVALTLTAARPEKGGIIATAREVSSREEAQALRGLRLFIERSALPGPEEEEFYHADLIGLEARSPAGEAIGRVKAVADFGAGDLLEIEPLDGGAAYWLPFTRESAPEVRVAEGFVVIVPPEG